MASLLAAALAGCSEAEGPQAGGEPAPPPLSDQLRRVRQGQSEAVRIERQLTETDLKALSGLEGLRRLVLDGTGVTDSKLGRLKELPNLELLRISGGEVTDAGLAHVAAMPALRHLILVDLPITDAGLRRLHGMKRLESLYLYRSRATVSGFDELREARPELHLHW